MKVQGVCAVLLLSAAPLLAAPNQPTKIVAAADDHLRAWIAADAILQAKIARATVPSFVELDLKDAVSDMPGPQVPREADCRDFRSCAVPPLAMDVPAGAPVDPAILAMMQPWIWLADAKGVRLGVAHADAQSPVLLAMNLQGVGLAGVGLNIEPRPEGGVHLWFSRAFELAAAYSREHDALEDRSALSTK